MKMSEKGIRLNVLSQVKVLVLNTTSSFPPTLGVLNKHKSIPREKTWNIRSTLLETESGEVSEAED